VNTEVERVAVTLEERARIIEALRGLAGDIPEEVRNMATAVTANLLQIRERVQESVRQAQPALRQLARAQGNVHAWEILQPRVTELLAPRGWLLPLRTALSGAAQHIVEIADRKGIEEAEVAIMAELSGDACRRIIWGCLRHHPFQQWRDHLLLALQAHEKGHYLLAVPVWLLVFDGVAHAQLATVLRDDSIFAQMSRRRRESLLAALGRNDIWDGYMTAFVRALAEVGRSTKTMNSPNPVLNRHAILHGLDSQYGTEKRSVQCIVLLEGLSSGISL
jgi:hypothetical protein